MSLRTDIQMAFDELTPSTHGMAERIVGSMLANRSRSRAMFAWSNPLRGATSMLALILVLVVAVGVLAGGRLYRDWSAFNSQPGNGLAALEARPMHLPVLVPGQDCPIGPKADLQGAGNGEGFGEGPVFGMPIGLDNKSTWGTYGYQWLLTRRDLAGPVLVRAKDLVTGKAVVFVGTYAAGPVTGKDSDRNGFAVKQHHEALLDTNHPPEDTNPPEVYFGGSDRLVAWQITLDLQRGASGCVAYQIDGPGFSEVFVVQAVGTGLTPN